MNNKPYAIVSDTHNHNWNAFSSIGQNGINSRLTATLNEFGRVAQTLKAAGGDTIYHAGDLFHVRGSVAPSVLNPTREVMHFMAGNGIKWRIMPGNHDMEMKEASKVGDSVQAVALDGAVYVADKPAMFGDDSVLMVPWMSDIEALKAYLTDYRNSNPHTATLDVILHAPVDGVIKGIPNHGLDPSWLGDLGFNRVFAGHYHNHMDFGNGVYSIGAIAHHTWSDVGSKAGFLMVYEDRVEYHATHVPMFVDIEPGMDQVEMKCVADGNFVRVHTDPDITGKQEKELREMLTGFGARGVLLMTVKKPVHTRPTTASIKPGASLESAVAEYAAERKFPDLSNVVANCQRILSQASVV